MNIATFEAAHARIGARITKTQMLRLRSSPIAEGPEAGVDSHGVISIPSIDPLPFDLLLKLECMQVTGSFKTRGALNRVLSLPHEVAKRGVITASGGNHGLAVAYAGRSIGVPTLVYLPRLTSDEKARRIEHWGARVVRHGDVWDDAHEAALIHAEKEGLTYIHPFAHPDIVAGQGTIALEILRDQAPDVDAFLIAIGGGGLITGVASAARLLRPGIRIIGIEPVGAPTLYESLRAGKVIELPSIQTKAGTLAPRKSDPYTFDIVRAVVDEIVLVTDEEMYAAARFLLRNGGIGVELSGAAAVAAVLTNKINLKGAKNPCALICGTGTDGATSLVE